MQKKYHRYLTIVAVISLLIISVSIYRNSAYAVEVNQNHTVVILNSYHKGLVWTDDETEGITSVIRKSDINAEIYTEYMDWKRFPTSSNLELFQSQMKIKYNNKKIDVIVCTDDAALSFAIKHRKEIFKNAPIVFCGVNEDGVSELTRNQQDITGVVETIDPLNTIQLAITLNPSIKNVYLIYDNTESGKSTGEISESAIQTLKSNLNIIPMDNKTITEILEEVNHPLQDSIILLTTYFMDKSGFLIDNETFCKMLSEQTSIPIYDLYDFCIGKGAIGGSMLSGKLQGSEAGKLALKILSGKTAISIPYVRGKTTEQILDYKELKKFHLPLNKISDKVDIRNRPFSFIQTYKSLVYSTLVIIALLLSFICVLLFYINSIRKMKKELVENHEELTQLYEELAATDEELRYQFNELSVTQENLTESEERYRLVVESINDGIWDWNFKTNTLFLSDQWYKLLGFTKKEFDENIGSWENLIHPDDKQKVDDTRTFHLEHKTDYYECEFRLRNKNENYQWVHTRGKALFDESGNVYRMTGSHMDISSLKEYQTQLQYIAYHDPLTGLYNRVYLYEQCGINLDKLREEGKKGALFFIDSDNFKYVNDTLGHSFGDKLIIEIGKRLLSLKESNCSLFRLGGDEFVIFLNNIKDRSEVEEYAHSIVQSFIEPFVIDGNVLNVTISLGIALYPQDGSDIDKLLRCADMAMYKVKEQGRNGYHFFNDIINDEMMERVNIEKHFKQAIENDEFTIVYQPQVNLENKKIIAFEALVRWNSPSLGMVPPLKFIPIAEETGFIITLGEWILKNACTFIKNLNNENASNYQIAVNISVIQLLQDDFSEMVTRILNETGLSASLLELEITESIIMESPELIAEKLRLLRNIGVGIALDDFGTGYSSLAYLRNIPITTLKIDKLFVDDITCIDCNNAVTDTIIALAHKMRLSTVAEGVETIEQLKYLQNNNCDIIQGYLFSKPLSPAELKNLINDNQTP